MRSLLAQVFHAVRSQRIKFGAPIVVRLSPFGLNPSLLLEAMQRGIQRPLVHLQDLPGDLPDALCDSPSVHRLERKSSQDQEVQRALNKIGRA